MGFITRYVDFFKNDDAKGGTYLPSRSPKIILRNIKMVPKQMCLLHVFDIFINQRLSFFCLHTDIMNSNLTFRN